MFTRTSASRHCDITRAGFSLIEILVVIGIIAILVSLIFFAVGPSIENARINATRTTIAQINDVIQKRVDAISRANVSNEAKLLSSAAGVSRQQAEFIIRKNLYRQALPQRIEDFRGYNLATGGNDDLTLPSGFDASQSNHCEPLFISLTEMKSVAAWPGASRITVPTLDRGSINPRHIGDVDDDGNEEFIDEWDHPLWFYTWPTRLIRPDGEGNDITALQQQWLTTQAPGLQTTSGAILHDDYSNQLNQDPDDPTGTAASAFGSSMPANISGGPNLTIAPFNPSNYHDADTFHFPLLVSGGPHYEPLTQLERGFGLTSPNGAEPDDLAFPDLDLSAMGQQTTIADLDLLSVLGDNITNRQQ